MSNVITKLEKHAWPHGVLSAIVLFILLAIASYSDASAGELKQKTFTTPEEAVKALVDAVKANSNAELLAIFGPGSEDLISSGDEVADKNTREKFLTEYQEKNELVRESPDKTVLQIGADDWPLPIPIVKIGNVWMYDTKAGRDEILSRRIGRDELDTIQTLHAYVDAQREYIKKDRDNNGYLEFAQKVVSSQGRHDGLYWDSENGGEESPLGPLFAEAAHAGYKIDKQNNVQPTPYNGYYYRILKGQGESAVGGQYDYVVNGKMILGFAMIAYPAKYGSSGIMTFIVNQDDIVYEKDLGKNTAELVKSITTYNPDKTWTKAE